MAIGVDGPAMSSAATKPPGDGEDQQSKSMVAIFYLALYLTWLVHGIPMNCFVYSSTDPTPALDPWCGVASSSPPLTPSLSLIIIRCCCLILFTSAPIMQILVEVVIDVVLCVL